MSAHLQFGPEWMRKAPAKNAGANGTAATGSGDGAVASQEQSIVPTTTASSARPDAKGKPNAGPSLSLGTTPSSAGPARQGMPTPTTPSAQAVVSPGAFSFAAAAGGAAMQGTAGGDRDRAGSSSSAVAGLSGMGAGEGDSMRYSKHLLSLYNTEKGGSPAQQSTPQQQQQGPPTGPTAASTPTRKKGAASFERDGRRNFGLSTDGANSNNGEPRGLNARAAGSSAPGTGVGRSTDDKYLQQRPGLFQRGSSYTATGNSTGPASNLSPTALQHSRERERFGAGIQGGVLSSVAPAGTRRSREGTGSHDYDNLTATGELQTPAPTEKAQQRAGNEAFSSVGRSRQSSYRSNAGIVAPLRASSTGADPLPLSGTGDDEDQLPPSTKEEWARIRRERLPHEGPLGPPADHRGGFTRYLALDRKRQRQPRRNEARMVDPSGTHSGEMSSEIERRATQSAIMPQSNLEAERIHLNGDEISSRDADFQQHAYRLVDALHLDDDEEQMPRPTSALATPQKAAISSWSAEHADWFYKDPTGQVQGPFKANVMQEWYAAKYFTDDLLIRPAEDEQFRPLATLLADIGDIEYPFLLPPSQYRINRAKRMDFAACAGTPSSHYLTPSRQQSIDGVANNRIEDARRQENWGFHAGMQSPRAEQAFHLAHDRFDLHRQPPFAHSAVGAYGSASPFGTPSASFAELGGGMALRQRQQDEYLAMIRQRELAEFRALQEQHGGNFASSHDPAYGGQGALPPNANWGSVLNMGQHPPHAYHPLDGMNNTEEMLREQNGAHRYNLNLGPQSQGAIDPATSHSAQPFAIHGPSRGQDAAWSRTMPEIETRSDEPREVEPVKPLPTESQIASDVKPEKNTEPKAPTVSSLNDTTAQDVSPEESQCQVPTANDDENSPERLWPQSPKAVEFASESPVPAEDATSLEEFTTKGKRNRRDKKRRDELESDVTTTQPKAAATSARNQANVNVVNEDQFRRSQATRGGRPSGQGSTLVPLVADDTGSVGATVPKAAPWANSVAGQDTNAGLSLREIQESEERRAGVMKASVAERRQRAQAQTSQSASDGKLPMSMSWGLASVPPSMHANDAGSAGQGQASGPVWNADSRTAPKKTLTEIQDEERKRTQRLRDVQASGTAASSSNPAARGTAGKGYADSASRVQPSATSATSPPSGWSVVGAGGKSATPAASAAVPPTSAASRVGAAAPGSATRSASSSGLTGGALSGWATAGPAGKNTTASPVVSSTSRPGQAASSAASARRAAAGGDAQTGASTDPAPSPDFVKYCKEQLKGMRSVNLDNFIEMLMQFPLDADNDTIEIIAEMVYANSSTLDGRRFAHDFVAKRKLDAAGRGGASNGRASTAAPRTAAGGLNGAPRPNASMSSMPSSHTSASAPRSASDVLRSDASASKGPGDAFGFKVVKTKGNKKRT